MKEEFVICYFEKIINNYIIVKTRDGKGISFKLNDNFKKQVELAEIKENDMLAIKYIFNPEEWEHKVLGISFLKSII